MPLSNRVQPLQIPQSAASSAGAEHPRHMQACPDEGTDEYNGYRLMYQLDRFTAGYRALVVFYLAMFIACYAQVVNTYVFWGSWCALVLMYWEPFLAPPYPWMCDYAGPEECLSRVEKWGVRPPWMGPADELEASATRQWLYAVRRGLNKKQMQAYKVHEGLIILPCITLWAGVMIHTFLEPLDDIRTIYSSCILLLLVSTYTLATSTSLVLHDTMVAPRLCQLEDVEVAWRTHDMMFFTCKILGETLNTTVQTLVAGAFVSYMPTPIFWLCILITAMSYTATNLLYGFEQEAQPARRTCYGGGSAWTSVIGSPGALWPMATGSSCTFGNEQGFLLPVTPAGHAPGSAASWGLMPSASPSRLAPTVLACPGFHIHTAATATPLSLQPAAHPHHLTPVTTLAPELDSSWAELSSPGVLPPTPLPQPEATTLGPTVDATGEPHTSLMARVRRQSVTFAYITDATSVKGALSSSQAEPLPHPFSKACPVDSTHTGSAGDSATVAVAATVPAALEAQAAESPVAVAAQSESQTEAASKSTPGVQQLKPTVWFKQKEAAPLPPLGLEGSLAVSIMPPTQLHLTGVGSTAHAQPDARLTRGMNDHNSSLNDSVTLVPCPALLHQHACADSMQCATGGSNEVASFEGTCLVLSEEGASLWQPAGAQLSPKELSQPGEDDHPQPKSWIHPQHQDKSKGAALPRRQRKALEQKGLPSPPFLVYKAPKGWREWCIVWLLMGVAAPSIAILVLLSWGISKGSTELYFEDPGVSCIGPCFTRYREILILLCTLGCLICYYAVTVAFLQAGPVTWAYRKMVKVTHAQLELLSEVGTRLRMTLAGG